MKRRRFLKRAALAAAAALGDSLSVAGRSGRARQGASPKALEDGGWPMFRGDRRLTGRARLPGEMQHAPSVAWRYEIEARKVWEVIHAAPERRTPSSRVALDDVVPDFTTSREGRAWGLGPRLVDLHGTGDLVPDHGRAAKLIPGIRGLQTVEFEAIVDRDALGKGQAVFPPKQAVCYAHDTLHKREIWRSRPYDTILNTEYCVADVDGDGAPEVAFAPHYRVIVYDGQTGRTRHFLKIHKFRNYGLFCCTPLHSSGGMLDFVIVANFAMHVDVVKNEGDHLRLLWRRDIEADIQSKQRIVQPGPNPVYDVNGDGRKEIVFNLFNPAGDGVWHVIAWDALTGEPVFDLPGNYLQGSEDVNGDGVPEMFVMQTNQLLVPQSGRLRLLRATSGGVEPLWERDGGAWATAEAPLPLTVAISESSGIDTKRVATARLTTDGRRAFFVVAPASTRAAGRDECLAFMLDSGRVVEQWRIERPARSRLEVRGCRDVDGDGVDEALIGFRQPATRFTRTSAAVHATAAVAGVDATKTSASDKRLQIRAVAVHPGGSGRPVVLCDGADDDVMALTPPARAHERASVLWRAPGAGPVVLADMNGDGAPEAVYATSAVNGEGEIAAAALHDGQVLWKHALDGFPGPRPEWNHGGITSWWVGHFTSGRHDDVWVSARRSTMHSDEAWALSGIDGRSLWRLREVRTDRTPKNSRGWGAGGNFVCAVDVDSDGLEDVVALYPVNYMAAKGVNGKLLHSIEAASGLFPGVWAAYSKPVVADFNDDGKNEILWCGAYHHGLTTLAGDVLWYHPGGAGMAGVGDVDGDGKLELGFTGWENGRGLRCLDAATGVQKWEMPLDGNPRATVYTADIDGDGVEEFLFAHETKMRAINGRRARANLVWEVELPSAPGDLTLADVDSDGRTEILFVGDDSALYCLDRAGAT